MLCAGIFLAKSEIVVYMPKIFTNLSQVEDRLSKMVPNETYFIKYVVNWN